MYISADFVKRLKQIQAIQNMYIRNGEWVIISGVKKYLKKEYIQEHEIQDHYAGSTGRNRSGLIMRGVFLNSYEKRAVEVRTAGDTESMYHSQ